MITESSCPFSAATCSGVFPSESTALVGAPLEMSSVITLAAPISAARCIKLPQSADHGHAYKASGQLPSSSWSSSMALPSPSTDLATAAENLAVSVSVSAALLLPAADGAATV